MLSRPNSLICPFLKANVHRPCQNSEELRPGVRKRKLEAEAEVEGGQQAVAVLLPGGDGEDVEDGVVGEEGGVGGDAVVEGQPRAHVLGAQAADASEILL